MHPSPRHGNSSNVMGKRQALITRRTTNSRCLNNSEKIVAARRISDLAARHLGSRWARIDIVFCLFFLLTIYFGACPLVKKGTSNELLFAFLFMRLAKLAKGLIGVVVPVLVFAAFVIVRRDWR